MAAKGAGAQVSRSAGRPSLRVERAPERPLFVWDGDCGFCRYWVLRWRAAAGEAADFAPFQEVAARFPEIPEDAFRRSAKLVLPDGRVHEAAASVFRLLALGGPAWPWRAYRSVPLVATLTEAVYAWVARHRTGMGRLTRLLWGPDPRPPERAVSGWVFGRLLGVVYLAAFLSLLVQVDGLLGPGGILPVGDYLSAIRGAFGAGAYGMAPTLLWLGQGTGWLVGLAAGGALAAALLVLDIVPLASGAAAWAAYLSLTVGGQVFLGYQWDVLVVEAGFLALFLLPARGGALRASGGRGLARPPFVAVGLCWWLLFRLVLESGLVKLTSGDPTWRRLTALRYHFHTQPLPNPVAFWADALPAWLAGAATAGTLLVELGAPLLLLLPRRARHLGAWVIIVFQLLIAATGNYGFLNLLTIVLALLAFDDAAWRGALARLGPGRRLLERLGTPVRDASGRGRRVAAGVFAVVAVTVGAGQVARTAGADVTPAPVRAVEGALSPFDVVNGYGLFAVMTTRRPEIVLEGRDSAGDWKPYDFRDKPDRTDEAPPQVEPHMPRLDWQMWFAALTAERSMARGGGRGAYDPWFLRFVGRLLRGAPAVTGLLAPDTPFRDEPPDAIRARLFDYRFTTPSTRRATGRWWSRREMGTYLPPVRLGGGGLVPAAHGDSDRGR
ncbi:MAG TPA: lipase maturation factor family protein [Gemmatimonadota bacterium]|nr:lipase maturation factor family protein [Gemmatimonadota bacterium]